MLLVPESASKLAFCTRSPEQNCGTGVGVFVAVGGTGVGVLVAVGGTVVGVLVGVRVFVTVGVLVGVGVNVVRQNESPLAPARVVDGSRRITFR